MKGWLGPWNVTQNYRLAAKLVATKEFVTIEAGAQLATTA